MVDHRPTHTAAPRGLRGVHRLQLGVTRVEHLDRADAEELAVPATAEERDGRVEEAGQVEGVDVLGRAVFVSEGKVPFEQRADVVGARIVGGYLVAGHAETVSSTRSTTHDGCPLTQCEDKPQPRTAATRTRSWLCTWSLGGVTANPVLGTMSAWTGRCESEMDLDSRRLHLETPIREPDPPAAVLAPGWYPDPYRRWRARYWDGRLWTAWVARPGTGSVAAVFGHDALARPPTTGIDGLPGAFDTPMPARVEALFVAELTRVHAEIETTEGVAEERGGALTRALGALDSLAAARELPDEGEYGEYDASPSVESALAAIPEVVRIAALCELHSAQLKRRRWWQSIVERPRT